MVNNPRLRPRRRDLLRHRFLRHGSGSSGDRFEHVRVRTCFLELFAICRILSCHDKSTSFGPNSLERPKGHPGVGANSRVGIYKNLAQGFVEFVESVRFNKILRACAMRSDVDIEVFSHVLACLSCLLLREFSQERDDDAG